MQLLVGLYLFSILMLSLYGLHRLYLLVLLWRFDGEQPEAPEPIEWPTVCVQIPLYNESKVAARILNSVAAFDYPQHLLEVQVLDDSDDETSEIVNQRVALLRGHGLSVAVLRRADRDGFKAGALEIGRARTAARFLAIFDADFVPEPDFLKRTIPFFHDPGVAFVQTRWSFLNRESSWFTRAQSILLSGHFIIEHAARFLGAMFFNFNGTAGVWRASAIERSGGWSGETLTEDLDLSYRAQLQGFRGIYLRDYCCASELPETIAAFKSQQYRWSKGMAQVLRKLGPQVFRANITRGQKLEAFCHLLSPFGYVFGFLIAVLLVPVSLYRSELYSYLGSWLELLAFVFTVGSLSSFYWNAQRSDWLAPASWKRSLQDTVLAVVLGIGITAHCAGAAAVGLLLRGGEFVRTQKTGSLGQRTVLNAGLLAWRNLLLHHRAELLLSIYLLGGLYSLFLQDFFLTLPFVVLLALGYVSVCSLHFYSGKQYE